MSLNEIRSGATVRTFTRGNVTATLYLGDCREILPTLGKVDAVVTDPPYEISASGGGIGGRRQYLTDTRGFTDTGFDYSILQAFDNWVCFGTLRQLPRFIELAGDRRWMLVTWNKSDPCPLVNGNYLPDTEYIVHAWRDGALFGSYRDKSRFICHPCANPTFGHPNEKPLRVVRKMVTLATPVGGVVVDPYMGSGTTGVAAMQLGRNFIGIEIEPKYFQIACDRIEAEARQGVFDLATC